MTEERLEIHYHLLDGAHSMDAQVRNKCEAELLALIRHLAFELGVDIVLETSAYKEGGLKEVWRFLLDPKNANAIGVAALLLTLVQISISLLALPASPDKEQENLTKQLTKLSIEEKKLQIQQLRKEAEQGQPSEDTVRQVVNDFNQDYKVVTRRSNFYRQLMLYPKVFAVGFGRLPAGEASPYEEVLTERSDFPRFIISTGKLPELVSDEALIEIVAPVITGGNMHWKGLHAGEDISFAMRDVAFKESVSNRTVSFRHGDAIVCVLHTERKLDPTGEVVVTGHYVSLVYEKMSATGMPIVTSQGRKKRFEDKHSNAQGSLALPPQE